MKPSAQSENCAAHSQNPKIAQAISGLRNPCAQSGDCVTRVRNLKIACTCMPDSEWSTVQPAGCTTSLISGVCLHRRHTAIWKSEQCCVLMSNGREVGCVQRLPVDRSWPQSAYMPHATGSIECYYLIVAATVETYLCWNCQPTFAVYYWSFSGTHVHHCSLFGLY